MPVQSVKVSVAIATYCGAKYLETQIRSILQQTHPVWEIVVVDDLSQDSTISLLENLAQQTTVSIRIIRNHENIGSTQSFAKAIVACEGDWIALADQDDCWVEDKIAKLLTRANQHSLDGIFSDAKIVDQDLRDLGRRLWDNSRFTKGMQSSFASGEALQALLKYNVVTGATFMFRTHFRDFFLPIPPGWIHDYWIAMVLAATGRLGFCEEPLILYRQHQSNQIGSQNLSLRDEISRSQAKPYEHYLKEADLIALLRQRLQTVSSCPPEVLNQLARKVDFLKGRHMLRESLLNRFKIVSSNLVSGNYFKFGQGWKTLVKDIVL